MKINVQGSIATTGYGIATRYLLKELHNLGVQITLFPMGPAGPNSEDIELYQKMLYQEFDGSDVCLKIWHQFDLASRIGTGKYIAYPFFELDRFKPREKLHLRVPDEIIVSCQWAKEIVEREIPGVICHIVHCGVDNDIFHPPGDDDMQNIKLLHKQYGLSPDSYKFINIGKWERRKGHDIIIRAFDRAFDHNDNVELLMAPYNPFLTPAQNDFWIAMYRSANLANKIHILPPVKSHTDVAARMMAMDCGVFPSRAEGWNLELQEMMACGKPVIATYVSAHTEFLNNDNAYLITVDGMVDAHDGIWFKGEGQWADLDYEEEEQLIEHMRYCYQNRPDNPAGLETCQQFSWKNAAKTLKAILE